MRKLFLVLVLGLLAPAGTVWAQLAPAPFIPATTLNGATASGALVTATGASVASSLGARVSRELNLIDDFGADPTGATDSQVAAQNFINACEGLAPWTPHACFVPSGTYQVDGLTYTVQSTEFAGHFRGAGSGLSRFLLSSGATGPLLTILGSPGYGDQAEPSFEDITFDGQYHGSDVVQCPNNGGAGYAGSFNFSRVVLKNAGRDNLWIGTNCSAGQFNSSNMIHPFRNGVTLNSGDWFFNSSQIMGSTLLGANVSNVTSGGGLIEITTATSHGLSTGMQAEVSQVGGVTAANGMPTVTVIDGTHFTENSSTFTGTYTSGGEVVPLFGISGVANNGSGLIRVTTTQAHNFGVTGTAAQVLVLNSGGVPNAVGVWQGTVVDTYNIDLAGSQFAGSFTSGGTIQAIVVGVNVPTAANTFDSTRVFDNYIGISMSPAGSDASSFIGGSIDSNLKFGILIQSQGVVSPQAFIGARFTNNSIIQAGMFPNIYLSNTCGEGFTGDYFVGQGQVNYLAYDDGTLCGSTYWATAAFGVTTRIPYTVAPTNDTTYIPISTASSSGNISGTSNTQAGSNSASGGTSSAASGTNSFAFGNQVSVGAGNNACWGNRAYDHNVLGMCYAGNQFVSIGDAMNRFAMYLIGTTTDGTTMTQLTGTGAAASSNNVMNMVAQQITAFPPFVIMAKSRANITDFAEWSVTGLVLGQGANAASTTPLVAATITELKHIGALASVATPTVGADTTHGGIYIGVVGASGCNPCDWIAGSGQMEFK